MRIVVALGGNALLRAGEEPTADSHRRNVQGVVRSLEALSGNHELVVTHGNGPQVGMLSLQTEAAGQGRAFPLDVLGAETQGMLGYAISRELRNVLPDREVAALLTQVEVDPDDPAFRDPSKPIGPSYGEDEARRLARQRGWQVADTGEGWQRVVPSPAPRRIVEMESLRILVDHGIVVVCAGGGGIPVVLDERGRAHGVEAVIDKDRTASLLARELGADALLLLTDVEGVYRDPGADPPEVIRRLTPPEVDALDLPRGSMGPKVEACVSFVEATGGVAMIGGLDDVEALLDGRAGTRIEREGRGTPAACAEGGGERR